MNNSFHSSINDDSTNSLPSPGKFNAPQTRCIHGRGKSTNHDIPDFDRLPRLNLFDNKAEIQYLPEDDESAALAYADREYIQEEARKDPQKSGYDFDTLLKESASPIKQSKDYHWAKKFY